MISYNRLWKLLIDKKIKKMEFKEMTGLGSSSISKLKEDIVEIKKDEE
ncbi:TPA: helix-turn-helix domain-containing protein [Clostridioides difficile]|nr:helix-turn-helix domain-containing protein [Clostridioides difficile]EGT2197695.1 helix-turn-helix domain-containing protein [Clostridioides difficile]EGT4021724.1 hypothetical protein [Clostridioides difficile]EGT4942695.1 hypothetical protein [Clostridioides difficile]MCR1466396.1 helix-turn-helix domain-containing protein [Clostridioides difficile]HBF4082222.1 helix-turn-helix domain-containing protein [Clostridioides difficile]